MLTGSPCELSQVVMKSALFVSVCGVGLTSVSGSLSVQIVHAGPELVTSLAHIFFMGACCITVGLCFFEMIFLELIT